MSLLVTFYAGQGIPGYGSSVSMMASLLAARGQRVLVVDWSLDPGEAPHRMSFPENPADAPGLLDLLMNHRANVRGLDWRECLVKPSGLNGAHLLPAGRAQRLSPGREFDWQGFYSESKGGDFLEGLRDAWLGEFDTVLLYCPRGSRADGICVIQMADVLALIFRPSRFFAQAASAMVKRAQRARQQLAYDRLSLLVFPIPMVASQVDAGRSALEACADYLGFCYHSWLPKHLRPWQVMERAQWKAGTEANGASYLFTAQLIEQGFRNAAELVPPQADPLRESERKVVEELESWVSSFLKRLRPRPPQLEVFPSYSITQENEGLHVIITQYMDPLAPLLPERISTHASRAESDRLPGTKVMRLILDVAEGVEIDEQAWAALVQCFKELTRRGWRVVIKEPGLQKKFAAEVFSSTLASESGEDGSEEREAQELLKDLEHVRHTRRDKS